MQTKTEKWQFRANESILGVLLVGARRGSRGPWVNPSDLPGYVKEFLAVTPSETNPNVALMADFKSLAELKEVGEGVVWQRAKTGVQGIATVSADRKPRKRSGRVLRHKRGYISNIRDLCDYFQADSPASLNDSIYSDTQCGASISVYLLDGTAIHNGDREGWGKLTFDTPIDCFTIQTIVEGSEATVDSYSFVVPVRTGEVKHWIADMESEADRIWQEANASGEDEQDGDDDDFID